MTGAAGREGRRSVLFLQGPLSPLYRLVADGLERRGHRVHRVNLSLGDRLDWRRPGAVDFRGRIADWPDFVDALMTRHGVTDLVLHGDRRTHHRLAAERARARGVTVIATELGYIRPDFMTIERDATSTGSHFPDDPDHIRRIAAAVPPPDLTLRYPGSFAMQAVPDVAYNLTNSLAWFLYPHFRRHTVYHPVPDYLAWAGRLATKRGRERRAAADYAALGASGAPFFVFAMQLEGDFQIRDHSPFGGMRPALALVLDSFRDHAPKDHRLLVKNHPLDNGLERWGSTVARLAAERGLSGRVLFLDGGPLEAPVRASRGLVTVNSTAGLEAILWGVPVRTLTPTIYDVAGLTDAQPLDRFWTAPRPPDADLAAAFVRAIAATVQVKGTIYSVEGRLAAAEAMAERIATGSLNAPDAFVEPPPRLARARAIGVPL
jgi:capsular polysaccharide export protein